MVATHRTAPVVDIRIGGCRLTIQRVPVWLITLVTTATGTGVAWWTRH
ncbi:hypothetical protein [Streptomyces sp. G45]